MIEAEKPWPGSNARFCSRLIHRALWLRGIAHRQAGRNERAVCRLWAGCSSQSRIRGSAPGNRKADRRGARTLFCAAPDRGPVRARGSRFGDGARRTRRFAAESGAPRGYGLRLRSSRRGRQDASRDPTPRGSRRSSGRGPAGCRRCDDARCSASTASTGSRSAQGSQGVACNSATERRSRGPDRTGLHPVRGERSGSRSTASFPERAGRSVRFPAEPFAITEHAAVGDTRERRDEIVVAGRVRRGCRRDPASYLTHSPGNGYGGRATRRRPRPRTRGGRRRSSRGARGSGRDLAGEDRLAAAVTGAARRVRCRDRSLPRSPFFGSAA